MKSPIALLAALALAGCAVEPPATGTAAPAASPVQRGEASFYGPEFSGRRTASGARFDPASDTAAHRSLPLGTVAEVTNLRTGESERVTIRDRGPFLRGRVIDVSPATARRLGMHRSGTAPVEVRPVSFPGENSAAR
jgi:rare lipoprotein A